MISRAIICLNLVQMIRSNYKDMFISKQIIVSIILLFSGITFGQNSKQKLDSIFSNEVNNLFKQGKLRESLALCKRLIKSYENINEKKSAIKVYVFAAKVNSNLFETKESLQYLNVAIKNNAGQDSPVVDAEIYSELGRNYMILGFTDMASDNISKSISIAKTLSFKDRVPILKYTYSLRSVIHEEENNIPALYRDLHLAHRDSPDTYTASRLGKFFIVYRKDMDSAKYYLNLGEKL